MKNLIEEIEKLRTTDKQIYVPYTDGKNKGINECLKILNQYNIITAPKQIKLSEIMKRLTYKELMSGYYPNEDILDTDCFDKLGQLEDLEEQLGCPLVVVFKALKYGIHIKIEDDETDIKGWKLSIFMEEQCFIINEMLFRTKLPLNEYKKTWWLNGDRNE